MMFGPYTAWIAERLNARRAELGLSYDRVVELSGLSKPTVHGALNGKQAIAIEAYVALCAALETDAARLMDDAEEAISDTTDIEQYRESLRMRR